MASENPFDYLLDTIKIGDKQYKYYNLKQLNDDRYDKLPVSVKILLEAAVRNCDNFSVTKNDVEKILNWKKTQHLSDNDIPFKPARVLLQDLTGVACIVDLAGLRDAYADLGGNAERINPLCQVDLVVDHSVQVDFAKTLMKIIKEQLQPDTHNHEQLYFPAKTSTLQPRDVPKLCQPCSSLSYCQYVKHLCFNHLGHQFYNQETKGVVIHQSRTKGIIMPDQHILASQSKLRYQTCPFHQELSVGADSLQKNLDLEFERNKERFKLFKWATKSMDNLRIIPPGSGIVHQINLEFLASVVCKNQSNVLYPDSLVGADSHTTMINGIGVVGYGCGGIECEAVMLGQVLSFPMPQVVGYKLTGKLDQYATSTDLVLTITKDLRAVGVVGKFVEFFGPGLSQLGPNERSTIANMAPEYGATVALFPVDEKTISYLQKTGRSPELVEYVREYLKRSLMFRNFEDSSEDPNFTQVYELDLSTVVSSVSGPKRPHDKVTLSDFKSDFELCLKNPEGFKGFGLSQNRINQKDVVFTYDNREYTLNHGSVVIAALTSCTNLSNPSVILGAGLLAKKAVELGLTVNPYIKTSLSPGSGVVTYYLNNSGVLPYFEKLGFYVVGYGCQTCIGNSGPLPESVAAAIEEGDLVTVGVLSGNRNFEGRVHPLTKANYLASPLIVVACAIAGKIIDFDKEPIGHGPDGTAYYLKDIWPTKEEIEVIEQTHVVESLFKEVYSNIESGSKNWSELDAPKSLHYPWDDKSDYLKKPFFYDNVSKEVNLDGTTKISQARCLLNLGDSISTDTISPAGAVSRTSPAYRFLTSRGVKPKDINSYGSYRGNDAVMVRGTFANIRLTNKLLGSVQKPRTLFFPTNEELDVYDAAMKYKEAGIPLIVLAGSMYGVGSSRDYAAKGAVGLGVRAIIAESYERIHRSNLVGMSILPLQYLEGQSTDSLGLTGKEIFTIDLGEKLTPRMHVTVQVQGGAIDKFEVEVRFDTEIEIEYYKNRGILPYMIRQLLKNEK